MIATLPMAHYMELEEIFPVRAYEGFADDVKRCCSEEKICHGLL